MVPPPSPRQIVLSLLVERLHIKVPPWVGLVALAIALPTGAWVALRTPGDVGVTPGPAPLPSTPPIGLQQWSAAVDVPQFIGLAAKTALPPPDPRQRKPPCDPDLEREINGWCWVPVDVKPCPKGKAWEHDGKCFAYALRSAPMPTSGEPRNAGVSGGAE